MARLENARKSKLQLPRMQYAINELESRGYLVKKVSEAEITFFHNNEQIRYFPYSGWATGNTINDGRGLQLLLSQLNPVQCQLTK